MAQRFADEQLSAFYDEFKAHREQEEGEREADRKRLQELSDALFRKENKDENVSPGLIQLVVRINEQLEGIVKADKKQKTFIGGILFAISTLPFIFTELGSKLAAAVHKVLGG